MCEALGAYNHTLQISAPCDRCSCSTNTLTEANLPRSLVRVGERPEWDAYLKDVYGELPEYPVDLGSFQWFWRCSCFLQWIDCSGARVDACAGLLNTSSGRCNGNPNAPTGQLLPISWPKYGGTAYYIPNTYSPPCNDGRREAYASLTCHEDNGTPVVPATPAQRRYPCPGWKLAPFGFWQWPAAQASLARIIPNNTWTEVVRWQEPYEEEGYSHATWWFAARGSGTWLNTGRTCVDALGCRPPNGYETRDLQGRWEKWAQLHGYDTIQYLGYGGLHEHEIIDLRVFSRNACSSAPHLRGGPAANRPCVCSGAPLFTRCSASAEDLPLASPPFAPTLHSDGKRDTTQVSASPPPTSDALSIAYRGLVDPALLRGRTNVANLVCDHSSALACTDNCASSTRKLFVIPHRFEISFNPFMTDLCSKLRQAGWAVMDAPSLTNYTLAAEVDIFVFYIFKAKDYDLVAEWRSKLLSQTSNSGVAKSAWLLLTEDILYPEEKYVMRKVRWFDAVLARYPETDISVLWHYRIEMSVPLFLFPHAATFARPLALDKKNASVLLSGDVKDCYPLRVAALNLLPSGLVTRRTIVLARMGEVDPMAHGSEYADVLSSYRIAIAGCARVKNLLWPVAKHFEIMAAGTAMLTDEAARPYLEPLGLLPGVHYLASTPEALEDTLRHWLAPSRRSDLNAITKRGQRVVLRYHMGEHRVRLLGQLAAAMWMNKQQHVSGDWRDATGEGRRRVTCRPGACSTRSPLFDAGASQGTCRLNEHI